MPCNPAIARGGASQIQPAGWSTSPLVQNIKSQSSPLVQIILNLEAEKYFFARHFVVEACGEAVACDYNSVFSRLVLCKTFRLEEDGKVLMLIKIVFIEI